VGRVVHWWDYNSWEAEPMGCGFCRESKVGGDLQERESLGKGVYGKVSMWVEEFIGRVLGSLKKRCLYRLGNL